MNRIAEIERMLAMRFGMIKPKTQPLTSNQLINKFESAGML